ncbi:MAG TPA: PA14 domain-containing protein [Chryseosolibacter sp.]
MVKNLYRYFVAGVFLCVIVTSAPSFATTESSPKITPPAPPSTPHLMIDDARQLYISFWVTHDETSTTEIYRSSTSASAGYVLAGTHTGESGRWTDENLKPRTQYYYRARSVKNGEYSAYSEVIAIASESEWVLPTLTATVIDPRRIELKLTDNSYQDESYEIVGESNPEEFYFFADANMPDSGRTETFYPTPLVPNREYTFYVNAMLHEEGFTYLTRVREVTVRTPFEAVQIETAYVGVTYVQLFVVNGMEGTASELQRSLSPTGPFELVGTSPGFESSFEDRNLTPGETYYYRARAFDNDGAGPWSEVTQVATKPLAYPTLTGRAVDENTIELTFTDNSSVEESYEIVEVAATMTAYNQTFTMADSGRTITFLHEPVVPGTTYRYIVNMHLESNEEDFNEVAEVTVTTPGSASTCANTGSIEREVWNNVPGLEVSAIPTNTAPSSTSTLTVFEAPLNTGSNYGARVRGFICPPATGNYTFWIASDDKSELWLSTTDNPAQKVKIASVTGYTSSRQWTKYSSQKSGLIALEQGKRYYIEALHKEATGGDHLAVGWQLPDGNFERPIPGSRLMKFQAAPPQETCSGSGTITWQVWTNQPGSTINYNTLNTTPNTTTTLAKFESPQYYGNSYLSRVRGYVCVPQSGPYTFWIGSDDQSDLWLSTDENPANKVKIASVTGYAPYGNWEKYTSQKSAAVTLVAGRKYYIEAVHKEGSGSDYVAVGWQLPNGTLERPIQGNRLLPYTESPSTLGVEIIEPTSDMKFDEPANIYIHAFPYLDDPEATIAKVEFFNGTTKLGEDATYRHEYIWRNVPQGTYNLNVKAYDSKGHVATAQVTINVAAPTCSGEEGAGYLDREIWRNISGTSVGTIPVNNEPDHTTHINSFETGTYYANDYGDRIRGYVCVPVTGYYTFWISSDDNSELWLSPDGGAAVKIASVTGATGVRQWTKYPSQQSARIYLKQGYKYYIEALHKEANGNDHVEVGWQLPDGTLERPIPSNRLIAYYVYSDYPALTAKAEGTDLTVLEQQEENVSQVLTISPNPVTTGTVTIALDGEGVTLDNADIQVVSMSGEVMHSESFRCAVSDCVSAEIRFQKEAKPGIYMLNVVSNGKRYSKKLIVK